MGFLIQIKLNKSIGGVIDHPSLCLLPEDSVVEGYVVLFDHQLHRVVRKMGASAQGWCTGKTQRDGMGREVGAGIRMGNTCKSMADSCQCMAKTTTIL